MNEIRDSVCPNCAMVRPVEFGIRHETITVKGEDIELDAEYERCTICGEEFADAEAMDRTLLAAYDVYRQRFGILTPDEIRAIRTK